MDPLFEYFMYLETCVPGGADGHTEVTCPYCSTQLDVEVIDSSGIDRYQCCECSGEFDVDWGEGTIHYNQQA